VDIALLEDEITTLPRNGPIIFTINTGSHPSRTEYSVTQLWKPKNSIHFLFYIL